MRFHGGNQDKKIFLKEISIFPGSEVIITSVRQVREHVVLASTVGAFESGLDAIL